MLQTHGITPVFDADDQDRQAKYEGLVHFRAQELTQAELRGWLGRQDSRSDFIYLILNTIIIRHIRRDQQKDQQAACLEWRELRCRLLRNMLISRMVHQNAA